MTPEKHFQDALDVLGTTFAAANELNNIIEVPITDQRTHDRAHELVSVLSAPRVPLGGYEAYRWGRGDAIEDTGDRALAALSMSKSDHLPQVQRKQGAQGAAETNHAMAA